ncbi:MAG: amidotransferase [Actinobacteria bacterium HGW-Actinobacteria-7]|jgi:GMP synthase-like glutamine amidotransferase|nr:MAG: amidotransferase [Actinobacteria bacterium HGW-Actinobacteria-7]
MRVHAICNVPYEGPALIGEWASQRGHTLTQALALEGEFPPLDQTDLLVVMGGPMDADDEAASPWLVAEKTYVRQAIDAHIPVLGVCLGAQIIAEVLGGKIRRAEQPEIGWFPVGLTPHGCSEPLFALWPATFIAAHWHYDTFDLPDGLQPALSSNATANQAFVFGDRVVGLQFHLEWTAEAVAALVENTDGEWPDGLYVTDVATMIDDAPLFVPVPATLLFELLDSLAEKVSGNAS